MYIRFDSIRGEVSAAAAGVGIRDVRRTLCIRAWYDVTYV